MLFWPNWLYLAYFRLFLDHLDYLRPIFDSFRALFWPILGCFWAYFAPLGLFQVLFGLFWALFCISKVFGPISGSFWPVFLEHSGGLRPEA